MNVVKVILILFRDSIRDLDERVIMSEGEVIYTDRIANEFFAEGMAANLARDENELRTFEFYYPESIDYFENMP